MAAYDPAVIHGYLTIVDSPPTAAAKGKAFEDLACYLLNGIPGITIIARNEMNTFATEEIDVACKNEDDPAGLGTLVDFFLVECKGWREAVNSEQVSWFLTKIRHRGVRFGILIAASGITGEPRPIGAEGDPVRAVARAAQGEHLPPARMVTDPHRLFGARGGQPIADRAAFSAGLNRKMR